MPRLARATRRLRCLKQAQRCVQVAAPQAEALLAEIIRESAALDLLQAVFQCLAVGGNVAHAQAEAITFQGAGLELALMPPCRQHLEIVVLQCRPVRVGAARQLYRKPLFSDRVTVFESRITHRRGGHAGKFRQLPGHPRGIAVALAHLQPGVLALAAGRRQRHFEDLKVFRRYPDAPAADRATPGRSLLQGNSGVVVDHGIQDAACSSSSTTASAAIPSPRPVKPRCSVVVALTLIRPLSTCRSAAIAVRMASM